MDIFDVIESRKKDLQSIVVEEQAYKFVSKIPNDIGLLVHVDPFDLVIAFYIVYFDVTFKEAIEEIEILKPFLDHFFALNYDDAIYIDNLFYDVKCEFEDKLGDRRVKDYLKINSDYSNLVDVQEILKSYSLNYTEEEVNKFLVWINDDALSDVLCIVSAIGGIKENLKSSYVVLDDAKKADVFSNKGLKMINNDINTRNGDYVREMNKTFKDDLERLKRFKDYKRKSINEKKKNINIQLKDLELLEKGIKDKSLTREDLNKFNLDSEVMFLALIELIKIRNEEFLKNYSELISYQKNPITKLESIFNECGYNFNLLTNDEQVLLSTLYDSKKIEENLHFINTSSLKFLKEEDEAFVKLLTLDIALLMPIALLLDRGKITTDFVLAYGNEMDSLAIETLSHNVNKLSVQKINFDRLSEYNDRLLLELNNKLLDILVSYGINLHDENIKHYEFLENSKLLDIIDKFIEVGLLKQIQFLPNLISNYSNIVIKRIILMQSLGKNYLTDKNTLNQVVRSGNDFYISDCDLNDYVYDNYEVFMDSSLKEILDTKDNLELLSELPLELSFIEQFKKSDQVYMINGNYFSRIKVLRCLKTLIDEGFTDYREMLFNCLIYNYPKHLSIETIEELKNIKEDIVRKQLI